jgi:hypothetical protein
MKATENLTLEPTDGIDRTRLGAILDTSTQGANQMRAFLIIRHNEDSTKSVLLGQSPISDKLYWGNPRETGEKYIITDEYMATVVINLCHKQEPQRHFDLVEFDIPL